MSNESGTVTVLDATVPRVRRVLEGFRARATRPAIRAAAIAYVSDDERGPGRSRSTCRGARVVGRVEVGEGARHISISPDGTRVVTSLGVEGAAARARGRHAPAAPAARAHVPRRRPRPRRRLHADGRQLWISSGVDRRLAVHDARTLRPLRALPGDAPPQHVTFDDSCTRVYVASGESGTLRTYRLADARLLRTGA